MPPGAELIESRLTLRFSIKFQMRTNASIKFLQINFNFLHLDFPNSSKFDYVLMNLISILNRKLISYVAYFGNVHFNYSRLAKILVDLKILTYCLCHVTWTFFD